MNFVIIIEVGFLSCLGGCHLFFILGAGSLYRTNLVAK